MGQGLGNKAPLSKFFRTTVQKDINKILTLKINKLEQKIMF